MLIRFLVFATLVPLLCFGQRFEFGAKVGVPLSETFETGSFFTLDFGEGSTSATRRYTVGPTVELKLVHNFSVEFDVLYNPVGFDDLTKSGGLEYIHTRTTAKSWEFPILGKFRFSRLPILRPYVDGGISFRRVSGVSSTMAQYAGSLAFEVRSSTGTTSETLDNRSSRGVVVGAGMVIHAWLLHISPEIRYTRWGADQNLDPLLYSNQNQVDLLLGVTF